MGNQSRSRSDACPDSDGRRIERKTPAGRRDQIIVTTANPMKIFGIGLSRTGTTSLTYAFAELGLRAHHFPRTRAFIDEADAATDTPVAAWYKELDVLYPGSKFIVTPRSIPDWLDSCEVLWRSSFHLF